MNVKEMTNEELTKEYETYADLVDNGSHGTKDVRWLYAVEGEIARRGGDFHTTRTASISKDMEDDELEQCATCGLMYNEGHEHKCEDTKTEQSKGWCCELCGGLIKGECMNNKGYVIHTWGNCSEGDE